MSLRSDLEEVMRVYRGIPLSERRQILQEIAEEQRPNIDLESALKMLKGVVGDSTDGTYCRFCGQNLMTANHLPKCRIAIIIETLGL